MFRRTFFVAALALLCNCGPGAAFKSPVPVPVPVSTLNVTAYLGRWYQVYSDLVVADTFEKDSVCVTADYGLLNSSFVSVFNGNRRSTVDGAIDTITGYAYVPDPNKPGELKVHLEGTPSDAPYWVLQLGPINDNGLYDFSIVSDNVLATLFVLTRDVARFESLYDAKVLQTLNYLGFKEFYNSPIKTLQGGCTYPWQPPAQEKIPAPQF